MAELSSKNAAHAAVDNAILQIDNLVREHRSAARSVAMSLVAAFVLLVGAGTTMHLLATYMAIEVTSNFNAGAQALYKTPITSSGSGSAGMEVSQLIRQIQPQVEAIAEHAKGAGTQNYNALLLSGAAIFALVFGLLMSVYRHHLTEISKAQHYKAAFTRMSVAMNSAESSDRFTLVQAALVDRAFEYRSGKEKQVESPAPGHPLSDASALLLDKLVETLAATKRARTDAS